MMASVSFLGGATQILHFDIDITFGLTYFDINIRNQFEWKQKL
jgi:hypothetical protein